MARIANAIRKAEAERLAKLRLSGGLTPAENEAQSSLRCAAPAAAYPDAIPPATAGGSIVSATTPANWDVHPSVVSALDRNCSITEQYRAVRTWLLSRMSPGERPCLALTSAVPREGKSVTTANLGVVLAEVRHLNVLLVDCDIRQSSLARLFKCRQSPGLAEVVRGRATLDEAIVKTPLPNLDILPAGNCAAANVAELLNSRTTSRVFDEIKERRHYVLVDTPPVQRLADVGVVGTLCTGVVMVVRMHQTASHLVRQSVRWLQSNNLNVLGCIAAACRPNVDRYAYTMDDREA